jgi:hypothetical protein
MNSVERDTIDKESEGANFSSLISENIPLSPSSRRKLISSQVSREGAELESSPWVFIMWLDSPYRELTLFRFKYNDRCSPLLSFFSQPQNEWNAISISDIAQIALYEGCEEKYSKIVNYVRTFLASLFSVTLFSLPFSLSPYQPQNIEDSHFENKRSKYTRRILLYSAYYPLSESVLYPISISYKHTTTNPRFALLNLSWIHLIGFRSSCIAQTYYQKLKLNNSTQEEYN